MWQPRQVDSRFDDFYFPPLGALMPQRSWRIHVTRDGTIIIHRRHDLSPVTALMVRSARAQAIRPAFVRAILAG